MFSNDQDEVADLFQEVLINLWKSLPSFEGRSDVRSWIYRVSLNVCISLDHKKRRHKTVPLTMDINPYEETETNQNSRQMDMLRQRIARLGQYDRAIEKAEKVAVSNTHEFMTQNGEKSFVGKMVVMMVK